VVLPPQPPPYIGKVLMAKTDAWHHGVSPSSRQQRLESLTTALRRLADAGRTAHGRNQDKPVSLCSLAPAIER
jgi:hypothetical protein